MRRVLAVVAAAAMVAGSLALRSRLDHKAKEHSQVLRLVCASELEAACQQIRQAAAPRIELTIEAPATTAERLSRTATADPGLDGWLATAPWPDIVDQARQSRALPPLFGAGRRRLARSPLVLVMWKDRSAAVAPRLCNPVGWRCLGDAAGTPGGWAALGGRAEWGPVKPGHADPGDDAGLLVLGQATVAYFVRSDVSTTDLDDDGFQRWFAGLERAVPPSPGSPLNAMLTVGPAAFDAVGTTEADALPVLRRSAPGLQARLAVLYPSPMATADLVLAAVGGDSRGRSLEAVLGGDAGGRALADAGWRIEGRTGPGAGGPPAGSPPLPPTSGLPSPGFLDALRTRWHEVTGR